MSDLTALIDGDVLVYRAGFAAEYTKCTCVLPDGSAHEFRGKREFNQWVKDNDVQECEVTYEKVIEPLENALHNVKAIISTIFAGIGTPKDYTIFLSEAGGETFRDKIATLAKYKGNRENAPRPKHYHQIREYLIKYYDTVVCEGIEADDALADSQGKDTVICSVDKDLLQIPGLHFNWVREKKWNISPRAGVRNLYTQLLTGDATDNIYGLKGYGPAKAAKILEGLETEEEMWEKCVETYHEYFSSSPDVIAEQGISYDDVAREVSYTSWQQEDVCVSLEDFLKELLALLKVGRP